MCRLSNFILGVVLSMYSGANAVFADADYDACKGAFTFAESNATYEDFDFWLGEWQVVDRESSQLLGYDKIVMIHDGCVLKQQWHQMDDRFSGQNAPNRLRGTSLTGINASGAWRQMWTDNIGSNIVVSGGLDAEGTMVLSSDWITVKTRDGQNVKVRNIWHWKPIDKDTIHNWGEQQRDSETGQRTKYFDIIYHRNKKGGHVFGLRTPE